MIIPIGHESDEVRRIPWVSFTIMAICLAVHIFSSITIKRMLKQGDILFDQAKRYYYSHPYLELDPEIEKLMFVSKKHKQLVQERLDSSGGEIPDSYIREEEQEELDRLTRDLLKIVDEIPFRKWGFIPAKKTIRGLITHMFMHGDWLHLIGNLFIFYLCGPFIEDVWGRLIFAGFYILMGIVAAVLYSLHYPNFTGPLIGASGAVAGVMGAFLIKFWKTQIKFFYIFFFPPVLARGTFSAPAWIMLPLWLVFEFINAKILDSMEALGHQGGGVAHWAHIWGFVFGVIIAVALKYFKVEEKYINPKIEAQTTYINENYKIFEEATNLLNAGKSEEAFTMLLAAVKKDPTYQDNVETLWSISLQNGKEREVFPYFIKLIESEIRKQQMDLAIHHYRQIKTKFPETPISTSLKLALLNHVINLRDFSDAKDLTSQLLKEIGIDSPPGILIQFSETVLKLDLELDMAMADQVIKMALQHPDIPQDIKDQLKTKLYSAPQEDQKPKPPMEDDRTIIPIPTDISNHEVPQVERFDYSPPKKLKVSKAMPISLKENKITLDLEKIGQRTLSLQNVQAISMVKITGEAERPFLLIDLFMDDPTSENTEIRIIRMLSNFNPQKFVPNAKDLLDAFKTFTATLLHLSGARAFPDIESVQLIKTKVYSTIGEYENTFK
jgi:membrane associated rhomboid family serine protease